MKRAVIVGGGISGLATAYFLREMTKAAGIDLEIVLLEKEDRTGGKIWSIKNDGYVCEWGPNGFIDSKPQTNDLCGALGIGGLGRSGVYPSEVGKLGKLLSRAVFPGKKMPAFGAAHRRMPERERPWRA